MIGLQKLIVKVRKINSKIMLKIFSKMAIKMKVMNIQKIIN